MKKFIKAQWTALILAFLYTAFLTGCGGGGAAGGSGGGTTVTSSATSISLSSTSTSVKSDNSDYVTITATVLQASNVVLSNQQVQFQASTGVIAPVSTTTDSNGTVTAKYYSGTLLKTNRTATITVTATGSSASASIPIQITGSTVTVSAPSPSPTAGTPVTITATTKSVNTIAASQPLRYSIAASSTGSGTLSATSGTTNGSGVATVNFTGTASGNVNVLVEWLDESGVATASAVQSFNVQASGAAFQVTTPTGSPWSVILGTNQAVVVNVPATINGVPVAGLRYATTLGTWQGSAAKTLTVNGPGATDTQTFVSGVNAGNANIQIDALSGTGATIASAKLLFVLTASPASAQSIVLQSNVYVLAPSSGGTASNATLTATVRDGLNNPVPNVAVLFELVNSYGSGELIDPVVATTNSSGVATSTFTAGTSSTTQLFPKIQASVIGNAVVPPDDITITVGGTAGSIAIGTSTAISSVNSDTGYKLPVTVMVTDSNGSAVSGATVSLSLWAFQYRKGTRAALSPCTANVTFTAPNEDLDENLILGAAEDIDGRGNMNALNGADGSLWPPSSAVGSVPATVLTGVDGTATFDWTYLKQYADWVVARLVAKSTVQGTEYKSTTLISLSPSKADVDGCVLPVSPFN